jgi:hypothetical protein
MYAPMTHGEEPIRGPSRVKTATVLKLPFKFCIGAILLP